RQQRVDEEVRARPGSGDADLQPLEVLRRLVAWCASLRETERDGGIPRLQRDSDGGNPPRVHVDGVLESAGDEVRAAADQRLEGFRAAREVDDLDLQALVLEVAEAVGQRERQIVEERLSAHGDLDVLLLQGGRGRGAARREAEHRGKSEADEDARHAMTPLARSSRCLPSSYPSSRSTSAVCSPSRGPSQRVSPGVADSFGTIPGKSTSSPPGRCALLIISRAR